MSATPLSTTQALNNSTPCSINGRIEFHSFDSIIEEHLEQKLHLSHRLINQSDKPTLIWGLREWLIRQAGYFDVIGYVRSPDLSYWYDREALVEEFDDLLLLFRDYVCYQKGIDSDCKYKLVRYMDNMNFILHEIKPGESEELTGLGQTLQDKFYSELWPELEKEFVKFEKVLQEKYGHQLDVEELFSQLFWNGNGLAWEAMKVVKTEE
jgi:hypothetical protein